VANVTINDAIVASVLNSNDFLPIWDTANAEQKKVIPSAIAKAIGVSHPGFQSNRWYLPHNVIEGTNTLSLSALNARFVPFFLPIPNTFIAMGVNVTTSAAAGGVAKLGIFKIENAVITSQVGEVEIITTSTGARTASFSSPVALSPGWYALGILPSLPVALSSVAVNQASFIMGYTSIGAPTTASIGGSRGIVYSSYAFTNPAGLDLTPLSNALCPAIFLQSS
jgi:hypothetical protein